MSDPVDAVIARLKAATQSRSSGVAGDRTIHLWLSEIARIVRESWPTARECVYVEDGDGVWYCSACKADWVFEDGDPPTNTMAYCPHCGARITESRAYVEEDDDGA